MKFDDLRHHFTELARTASPDEYFFAEDRASFDRLRIGRVVRRTVAVMIVILGIASLSLYALGIRMIGPGGAAILTTALAVVPDAENWATHRANVLLQQDSRVISLLFELQSAPPPTNAQEWVSRYSNAAPPLSGVPRDKALMLLANRIMQFDPASRNAVIDEIVTVGSLLGDPEIMDVIRDFSLLSTDERLRIKSIVKRQLGLRDALGLVKSEIDQTNERINDAIRDADRQRAAIQTIWQSATNRQRQCYAQFRQTTDCLGAILAK